MVKKKDGVEGQLTWNPQGAAVIKMVAELIGELFGNPELFVAARVLKKLRKASEGDGVVRDPNAISEDIIPEHMQYLAAARGAEGQSRVADYRAALEAEIPISLIIMVGQTQLGVLMKTMKG